MLRTWLVIICLLSICFFTSCKTTSEAPAIPEQAKVYSVLPEDLQGQISTYASVDNRPYEFVWADRVADYPSFLHFEANQTIVVSSNGTSLIQFEKSKEQQLFGTYTAKFTCSPENDGGSIDRSSITLLSADLIAFNDSINRISMWVWLPVSVSQSNLLHAEVVVHNALQKEEKITLPIVGHPGWNLIQKKIDRLPAGLHFSNFSISGLKPGEVEELFIDSVCLYSESAKPLTPVTHTSLGLSGGNYYDQGSFINEAKQPGQWDLTLAPQVSDSNFEHYLVHESDILKFYFAKDEFRLHYEVNLNNPYIVYAYRGTDKMAEFLLSNSLNDTSAEKVEVIAVDQLSAQLTLSSGLKLRYEIDGKTLSILAEKANPISRHWTLEYKPIDSNFKHVKIPFLSMSGLLSEVVAFLPGEDFNGQYVYIFAEPALSNASNLSGIPGGIGVQAAYLSSEGKGVNNLHEKFIITVSPSLHEVLPRFKNDLSKTGLNTNEIWRGVFEGRSESNTVMESCSKLTDLGLTSLRASGGKICWSEGDASSSFRVRGAPYMGGDSGLSTYLKNYHNSGFSMGIYLNYLCCCPLNGAWDPLALAKTVDGSYAPHDNRFIPKASIIYTGGTNLVNTVADKFKADFQLHDLEHMNSLSQFTDFDTGSLGYATFKEPWLNLRSVLKFNQQQKIEVIALNTDELLVGDQVKGHVSEEPCELNKWFPLFPAYRLGNAKAFPLRYGLGPMEITNAEELDSYICAELAYGLAGRIMGEPDNKYISLSYYTLKEAQKRYLGQELVNLNYFDGTKFHSLNSAVATEAYKESMLYLQYENGLECWINGSDKIWDVEHQRKTIKLPPKSWMFTGDDIFQVSTLVGENRVDYIKTPELVYFNSRGKYVGFQGILSDGTFSIAKNDQGFPKITLFEQPENLLFHYTLDWDIEGASYEGITRDGSSIFLKKENIKNGWVKLILADELTEIIIH